MAHQRQHSWLRAIIEAGLKNITAGANPVEIKTVVLKRLWMPCQKEELTRMSIKVSKKRLPRLLTIAANNDEEIGNQIADAMEKLVWEVDGGAIW